MPKPSFVPSVVYLSRYVMRPRERSYGDSSTRTRSPGRIRMKFIRSLPLMCASTRCLFSNSMANIAFGSGSMTVPSTSIASFLATGGGYLPVMIQVVDEHARRTGRSPLIRAQKVPGLGPAHDREVYQRFQVSHNAAQSG